MWVILLVGCTRDGPDNPVVRAPDTDTGLPATDARDVITITVELPADSPAADTLAVQLFLDYEPYAGAPLTGETTVFDPPDPDLALLDEETNYPGQYSGWFYVAVVDDTNDDGAWAEGEALVATPLSVDSLEYVLYTGGILSSEAEADGVGLGWYRLYDEIGPCCSAAPPEFTLRLNLLAIDLATVGGTASITGDVSDVRMALVTTLPELQGAPAVVDIPYADTWAMELPSLPPVDNLLVDSEWGGVTHAAGAVVAYRDVDGSGSETAGDERLGMLCDGENQIGVEWVEAPDTMAEAAWLSTWGFRAGWQVGVIGSTGRLLPWFYVRGNPSLDPATLRLSETGICE